MEKLNRFSKQCRPLFPNGTERNNKNYRFTAVLLRNRIWHFFLSPTVAITINNLPKEQGIYYLF